MPHGVPDVLLVDDNEMIRNAVRGILARAGMTVVGEVASGEAALDAVEALAPDLILMDVCMPGIGGLEATRRLTQRGSGPVVVLVSADPLDRELALAVGASAFARKETLSARRVQELWRCVGR